MPARSCPVKTSKEWEALSSSLGDVNAYKVFIHYGEEVPPMHIVDKYIDKMYDRIFAETFQSTGFKISKEERDYISEKFNSGKYVESSYIIDKESKRREPFAKSNPTFQEKPGSIDGFRFNKLKMLTIKARYTDANVDALILDGPMEFPYLQLSLSRVSSSELKRMIIENPANVVPVPSGEHILGTTAASTYGTEIVTDLVESTVRNPLSEFRKVAPESLKDALSVLTTTNILGLPQVDNWFNEHIKVLRRGYTTEAREDGINEDTVIRVRDRMSIILESVADALSGSNDLLADTPSDHTTIAQIMMIDNLRHYVPEAIPYINDVMEQWENDAYPDALSATSLMSKPSLVSIANQYYTKPVPNDSSDKDNINRVKDILTRKFTYASELETTAHAFNVGLSNNDVAMILSTQLRIASIISLHEITSTDHKKILENRDTIMERHEPLVREISYPRPNGPWNKMSTLMEHFPTMINRAIVKGMPTHSMNEDMIGKASQRFLDSNRNIAQIIEDPAGIDTTDDKKLEFHLNTLDNMTSFLDAIGVDIRLVEGISGTDGTLVEDAIAAANFIDRTVDILDSDRAEAWNKLPEEAAHWWYSLIANSGHPLAKALKIDEKVLAKYEELKRDPRYNGGLSKVGSMINSSTALNALLEEAIGQVIAEEIKRLETVHGAKPSSFYQKFIKTLRELVALAKSLFTSDPVHVAAIKILANDTSDLLSPEENDALWDSLQAGGSIDVSDALNNIQDLIKVSKISGTNDNSYKLQVNGKSDIHVFHTSTEMINWVTENIPQYTERQREAVLRAEEANRHNKKWMTTYFKKRSKFMNRTLDKLFKLTTNRIPEHVERLRSLNPASYGSNNIVKTVDLSKEEKAKGKYESVTPTLKVFPALLQKYAKNPISLSSPISVDGMKKPEKEILTEVQKLIKDENPNMKTITAEEFVNEAHNYLQANWELGFLSELDINPAWSTYGISNAFSNITPETRHSKISIRFNDAKLEYQSDNLLGKHWKSGPIAWGSLTPFQDNVGNKKVMLHEIQSDVIEYLLMKRRERDGADMSKSQVERMTSTFTADVDRQVAVIKDLIRTEGNKRDITPVPTSEILHMVAQKYFPISWSSILQNITADMLGPERAFSDMLEHMKGIVTDATDMHSSYSIAIDRAKEDMNLMGDNAILIKERETKQGQINAILNAKLRMATIVNRGGFKEFFTEHELDNYEYDALARRENPEDYTPHAEIDDQIYTEMIEEAIKRMRRDYGKHNLDLHGFSTPTAVTAERDTNMGISFKKRRKAKSLTSSLSMEAPIITHKLNRLLKVRKDEMFRLNLNLAARESKENLSLMDFSTFETMMKSIHSMLEVLNAGLQTRGPELLSTEGEREKLLKNSISKMPMVPFAGATEQWESSLIPYSTFRSREAAYEAVNAQFNNRSNATPEEVMELGESKKQNVKIDLDTMLEEEVADLDKYMTYFTPLVHHLIKKHIKENGKHVPLLFSGFDATRHLQSNTQTAAIYAGPDELIVPYNYFVVGNMQYAIDPMSGEYNRLDGTGSVEIMSKKAYDKIFNAELNRVVEPLKLDAWKQILQNDPSIDVESFTTSGQAAKEARSYVDKNAANTEQAFKSWKNIKDRWTRTMLQFTRNKPYEIGALYNAMKKIDGVTLKYAPSVGGLTNSASAYVMDLSEYAYAEKRHVLFGKKEASKDSPQTVNPIDEANIQRLLSTGKAQLVDDQTGNPCMADGGQFGFTPGGDWRVVREFKGKSHAQGGIDIAVSKKGGISLTNKQGTMSAEEGLVLASDEIEDNTDPIYSGGTQPEAIASDVAPEWLTAERKAIKKYPKFERSVWFKDGDPATGDVLEAMHNTERDTYVKEQVSKQILKSKPYDRNTDAEAYMASLSDKEQEYITGSIAWDKTSKTYWDKIDEGMGTGTYAQGVPKGPKNKRYTEEEHENATVLDALEGAGGVVSKPAQGLLNSLGITDWKNADGTNYNFTDGLKGKQNDAGFIADMVTDLTNFAGIGIAAKFRHLMKVGKFSQASGLLHKANASKKFASEINWGKWNKKIPKNKALMKEYNTIEATTKADGTWMKNADGSDFRGSPEQFVQQRSKNFKKAFPDDADVVYRGTKSDRPEKGQLLFSSENKDLARNYAPHSKKEIIKGADNKGGGVNELYLKNSDNSADFDLRGQNWAHLDVNHKSTYKDRDYIYNIKRQKEVIDIRKKSIEEMKASGKKVDKNGWTLKELEDSIFNGEEAIEYMEGLLNAPRPLDNDVAKNIKKRFGPDTWRKGRTSTDEIGEYMVEEGIDNVKLRDIDDSGIGNVRIINNRPGNFVKSAKGNSGEFDMADPNIYQSRPKVGKFDKLDDIVLPKDIEDLLKLPDDEIYEMTRLPRMTWEHLHKNVDPAFVTKKFNASMKNAYKIPLADFPVLKTPSVELQNIVEKGRKTHLKWLRSDEWLTRRMNAVPDETPQQALALQKEMIEELKNAKVQWRDTKGIDPSRLKEEGTSLGSDINLSYDGGELTPELLKKLEEDINHEMIHSSAWLREEEAFRGIPMKKDPTYGSPSQQDFQAYLDLDREQQVRGVRTLNHLKKLGLWDHGDEITDGMIKKLKKETASTEHSTAHHDITELVSRRSAKDLKKLLKSVYAVAPFLVGGTLVKKATEDGTD